MVDPQHLVRAERKIVSIFWLKRDIEKWLFVIDVDMPEVTLSYEHELPLGDFGRITKYTL